MRKKRLGKLSLDTMEFCFQPLKEEHLREITGGGYVSSYTISGGTITNWSYDGYKYAVFTDSNGGTLVLEGVHVGSNTLPFQQSNTACYIGGEIRIGSGWSTFSFDDLTHEYGHYLQEKNGYVSFLFGAAGSAVDILINQGKGHSNMSFEKIATSMGNAYVASYYSYSKFY